MAQKEKDWWREKWKREERKPAPHGSRGPSYAPLRRHVTYNVETYVVLYE